MQPPFVDMYNLTGLQDEDRRTIAAETGLLRKVLVLTIKFVFRTYPIFLHCSIDSLFGHPGWDFCDKSVEFGEYECLECGLM